jgi:hypothetical protein
VSTHENGLRASEPPRLVMPIALCILPLVNVTVIFLGLAAHGASIVVLMWYLGIAASILTALWSIGATVLCIAVREHARLAVFLLSLCLNGLFLWAVWQVSQFRL